MKIKLPYLLISYAVVIIYFGFIYCNIPNIFPQGSSSFIRGLYFSVITITTLGYGDIALSSKLAMGFVALESMIGIAYIALFSGAIWQTYLSTLEKTQAKQIRRELALLNSCKLKMFENYLVLVINEYRIAYKQFMIPLSKVSKNSKLNVDFKYDDLKYILENSTNQAVVGIFYEKHDSCNENLKYLLSNSEIFINKRLYTAILSFLHLSLVNDPRNAVLSTATEVERKPNVHDQTTRNQDSATITKSIKTFYKTLKMQYTYLKIIRHELATMTS